MCEALSSLAVYRFPDPYIPLAVRVEHFLQPIIQVAGTNGEAAPSKNDEASSDEHSGADESESKYKRPFRERYRDDTKPPVTRPRWALSARGRGKKLLIVYDIHLI